MTAAPPDTVSHETMERLEAYHTLLLKWQKSINLVSPNTINQAWERHFLDSLQILDLMPAGHKTLFDLGSGAGFPGLVLACADENIDAHMVESDQRKCSFMRAVSRETKTPATIHNVRIESFETDIVPDVITARALASLKELCAYILPWANKNKELLLLLSKGRNHEAEIAEALESYSFECAEHASKIDPESVILRLTGLCKRDSF